MNKLQEKLQAFAGAMMVPIILLVLVGFYVGIGSAFSNYIVAEGTILHTLFTLISSLGFMFMNNLQVWFAVGIAFTLARKEKGWAAFSGIIMYFSFLSIIQTFASIQGYTADTVTVEALVDGGMGEMAALNFSALWGTTQGFFGYNMGIFSGIISGLVTASIHNKWVDKEMPSMLGFFAGTKFVVIMVTLLSVPLGIFMYYVWPYIGMGLQSVTGFISSSGLLGTFVFGALDKLLLPLGIHHLIAFPIEYSSVGGTMMIDGQLFEGVRNIIVGQAGSADATGYIIRNFTTGRILLQLAGLPGAALAMYHVSKPENKKRISSLLVPAIITLAFVGISEPIEYTFLFVAPLLYFLVYAPLAGLSYVAAEMANVSINGHALLFMIPNIFQPQKVHAIHLLWLLPLTFALFYFIFKFVILKFNLKTPGRSDAKDSVKLVTKQEYRDSKNKEIGDETEDTLERRIVEGLGGPANIKAITCCATRLRVQVEDDALVADNQAWTEHLDAMGVVRGNKSYQIIYGVQVGNILTRIKDLLNMD